MVRTVAIAKAIAKARPFEKLDHLKSDLQVQINVSEFQTVKFQIPTVLYLYF